MPKNYLDSFKLPSGNKYYLKDTEAREAIAALEGGSYFLGVTTTALEDQATTNPIKIDGEDVTAKNGNIAIYGNAEFIFNGTKWIEFGDLSALGQLAYKDSVSLSKGSGANVLGEDATFSAQSSSVSFAEGAGSDFVTGYNNDAVAPSFSEGAFTPAAIQSGFVTPGSAAQFTEGAFTPAAIQAGFVTPGSAPSFSEGAFTPAAIQEGFVTPGSAASYSHSGFSGGSLGASSKSAFATEGMTAAMGSGEDAETLIFSAASTSNAVTEQGTFTPASYGTDTFDGGTPTAIDVTKFSGGSKLADSFDAGSVTTIDTTKFSGGAKAADTFVANTPTAIDTTKFSGGSKVADTFNAGSAPTLAKAKALTASDTGTAAAQTVSVNSKDAKKIALYDDLGVSVS